MARFRGRFTQAGGQAEEEGGGSSAPSQYSRGRHNISRDWLYVYSILPTAVGGVAHSDRIR